MIGRLATVGGLAALLLAGCVTPPARVAEPTTAPAALPARGQTLERDYRARATVLIREQRWAEAKVQLELLLLLHPGAIEYRTQLDSVRKNIAELAAEANAAAATARKRGDLDTATAQYLRALAADRDNAVAAQGLREIERERARRAWLNRPPRSMLGVMTGKPDAPAELEPEYMQRSKPGNGNGNETAAPRR